MNVQIYLNIYDKKFGRLKKRTYLCIVNLINVLSFCLSIENTVVSTVLAPGPNDHPPSEWVLKRFENEKGEVSPFLYIYTYMKLLDLLKENILITEKLNRRFRLFPNITKDGITARVFQTGHQKEHRNGDQPETSNVLEKIADGKWKTGANSLSVRKQIFRNLDRIIKEFSEFENLNNKVILFIDKFINPAFPNEEPTYIEYVLAADKKDEKHWDFEILSSAHSLEGEYLASLNNDKVIRLVENVNFTFNKVVYL